VRIVVDWKNVFKKQCKSPIAVVFIRDDLDHSCYNEVKTLDIANNRVTVDISSEDMPYISDNLRIF
jgi:hypothetical protein